MLLYHKVLLHLQNEYEESELCGFIVRTSGANASFSQLLADADSLIKQLQSLMFKAKSSVSGKCLYKSKSVLREIMNRTGIGEDSAVITDDEAIYKQLERENENRFAKVNIEFYNNELPLKAVYELEHILKEAVAKKVWLKGGGYLILEPTEALTVIDVNSGKDIKGRDNKEEHILKVNLQAAKEIARQIMLRNYSGIIIVDFIDMKKAEHKKELLKYLKEQLLMDSVKTVLVDITRLGLVEITRRKLKKPLYEQWRDFKDN